MNVAVAGLGFNKEGDIAKWDVFLSGDGDDFNLSFE